VPEGLFSGWWREGGTAKDTTARMMLATIYVVPGPGRRGQQCSSC
jgi:hypothetical protein